MSMLPDCFRIIMYCNIYFQMGRIGLNAYSMGVSLAVRADVFSFFNECFKESTELLRQTNEVLLSKGLYIRSPYLEIPDHIDFVKKQNFLSGYFDKRPLTALEITNIFGNYERNALGIATLMGFSQIAQSKEVRQYLKRGKEIAQQHCEKLGNLLKEEELPVPTTWDAEVTASTSFTFSDKLMMFYTTALTAISLSYYGAGTSSSPRRDVAVKYASLGRDIALYAEDGANLMISNGWFEEPPRTLDRDELVKNK
ncbi:DUF3231 family protein [Metabacillus sp. Hm71]|uniref:DUF3231 family protein n=1 Tax=Metabacillus sp. Hm71 TaxID=3450743 RepID=UPI003F4332ED